MNLTKEEKLTLIKDFGNSEQDTGSVEVQIAFLTSNIKKLTEHLKGNHKDYSSKRGMIKMISRRRIFLDYLHRTNEAKYKDIIERLGLKR